jgi:Family of unknown function (DUF5681)
MNERDKPGKKVGYCNPPEHTRFRPGHSGNPAGRPKGTLNLATVLQRALREKIVISKNGRRIVITKMEAAIRQLVDKASAGDLKALQQVAAFVKSEGQEQDIENDKPELAENDSKVIQGILWRFQQTQRDGGER